LFIGDSIRLFKSLVRNTIRINAFLYEIILNRRPTSVGELQIVCVASNAIGVSGKTDLLVFVLVHESNESIQDGRRFRLDGALVKIKENIIENNRPFHLWRRRWWRRWRRRWRRWRRWWRRWWWWRRRRWRRRWLWFLSE